MGEKNIKETDQVVFEDALTCTGFGKYNLFIFILASSIIVAMAFETFSVAYLVPSSACELGTDSAQQGLIAGVPLIGIITCSNMWGYLADTRGRKKTLIWSLGLGFITGTLATFSMNWIVFCFLKFASSSSLAGAYALAMSFLGESTPEKQRGTMIILTSSIYLVSTGIMAALTIPILPLTFSYYISFLDIHFNSWRLLNFVYTLPSFFGAILLMFAYESPKYLLSAGFEEESLEVLRKMYTINRGDAGENFKVKSVQLGEVKVLNKDDSVWQSIKSQTLPLFKPPLLKNTLLLATIFVTVYFCINPFMIWLPNMTDSFMKSIQRGETGLTMCEMIRSTQNATNIEQVSDCTFDSFAMTMILAINILLSMLNLLITVILKFCSKKTVLISIQMICGAAGLCINASSNYILSAALMFVFISGVLNFGFTMVFSVDLFPTYVKAMGVCVTLMVGRGSAVLGINLLNYFLVRDCETAFYFFASIALFGGLCGFFLPAEKKHKIEGDKTKTSV